MKLYKRTLCIVGAGLLLSGTQLFAEQMNAKEIVRKAYAQIGSMDQYAFNAIISDNETIDGQTTTYIKNVSVKIDRPGNLRADTKGDIKDRSTYIHNGEFTMIDHRFGYYTQLSTPETIDATLDYLFDKFGIRTPLSTLMYSDMGKRINFKKNKYFGTVDVAGVSCDYVAFSNGVKEIHVWITKGETPLVKTYSIINGDTRINATLVWDTDPKLSKSDFIFKAPKDATKISVSSAN
ncbi:DUF2092 domain-containing protein [Sulfurovum sp.]|uniref:DUF2092 domain-containing protein n=1 Tax=Sulfurovum sp. TaxID=1969726 RepID=UPI002867D9E0|nr:DUF2092 domain-containing protein [Sulfurovum sp.]